MTNSSVLASFHDVSFSWLDPETGAPYALADGNPSPPVFDGFTADIPTGFISLVGPNGAGKSTFLLLAGSRVLPTRGTVSLLGEDTRTLAGGAIGGLPGTGLNPEVAHRRNLLCSFIYQNMELEPAEDGARVAALLDIVYGRGGHVRKDEGFMRDVVAAFELEGLRDRRLDALSKGESQRVLLGFAALYGSRAIMMDEPVFAMENRQKERALEFFRDVFRSSGVSIMVSLHELALTRKYADTVMLFYPDRRIDLGSVDEVLTAEALEAAYGVPPAMLYDVERLQRRVIEEGVAGSGA